MFVVVFSSFQLLFRVFFLLLILLHFHFFFFSTFVYSSIFFYTFISSCFFHTFVSTFSKRSSPLRFPPPSRCSPSSTLPLPSSCSCLTLSSILPSTLPASYSYSSFFYRAFVSSSSFIFVSSSSTSLSSCYSYFSHSSTFPSSSHMSAFSSSS